MAQILKQDGLYNSKSLLEMKELQTKSLNELQEIAKERGVAVESSSTKTEIISALYKQRGD